MFWDEHYNIIFTDEEVLKITSINNEKLNEYLFDGKDQCIPNTKKIFIPIIEEIKNTKQLSKEKLQQLIAFSNKSKNVNLPLQERLPITYEILKELNLLSLVTLLGEEYGSKES